MKNNDKLITDNIGYVVTVARQYKSDILSTDDLVSEGCIGLMKAARKFDPERGKPFITFAAPYIRQAIESAIGKTEGPENSKAEKPVRSMDEPLPVGSKNNYTLLNVLEDPDAKKADAMVEEGTLSDDLVRVIGILNDREQAVVTRFFGIGSERQTMAEIADSLELKRERVRQIRNQAVRKLRKEARRQSIE